MVAGALQQTLAGKSEEVWPSPGFGVQALGFGFRGLGSEPGFRDECRDIKGLGPRA